MSAWYRFQDSPRAIVALEMSRPPPSMAHCLDKCEGVLPTVALPVSCLGLGWQDQECVKKRQIERRADAKRQQMACAQHLLRMPPPSTCDPLWARYSAFQESRQKTRSGARAVAEVLCGEQQHEGRESQARSRARWATYEEGLGGNATEWRAIYNDAWHSRLWLELYPDGPPEPPDDSISITMAS